MKKGLLMLVALLMITPMVLMAQSLTGDWKISVPGENGEMLSAKLSIKADNTYHVDFGIDGIAEVKGEMTVNGDKITIQDTEGAMACTGANTKGVYTYTVDATSFTMTKVSDNCEGRGGEGKMVFSKM